VCVYIYIYIYVYTHIYIRVYDVRNINIVGDRTYDYLYMVSGVWPKNNLRSLCRKNLRLEQVLIPKFREHVVRIKR
jgi:hypothetical protein